MVFEIFILDTYFISLRAFIPSLRVFKTSQEREEIIIMASKVSEIKVESTWLAI